MIKLIAFRLYVRFFVLQFEKNPFLGKTMFFDRRQVLFESASVNLMFNFNLFELWKQNFLLSYGKMMKQEHHSQTTSALKLDLKQ